VLTELAMVSAGSPLQAVYLAAGVAIGGLALALHARGTPARAGSTSITAPR
jgi:hypothetical protein